MSHVKAKAHTTVPYKDGRHVQHEPGDVISLAEASDHFNDRWSSGDEWLTELFESADGPGGKKEAEDPHDYLDPHRTLPISGVDHKADAKVAKHGRGKKMSEVSDEPELVAEEPELLIDEEPEDE